MLCVVDQEPRGEKTAVEKLQYVKTVFSENGADWLAMQSKRLSDAMR